VRFTPANAAALASLRSCITLSGVGNELSIFEETRPMALFPCRALIVGTLLTVGGVPAHAYYAYSVPVTTAYFYPECGLPAPVTTLFYYAPPLYTVAPPPCITEAQSASPATPYATPRPAPPSAPAPSAAPGPAPKITESRSRTGRYPPGFSTSSDAAKNLYRVGFWNLAGRDLTITVDGQVHSLPQGRAITVSLGRRFVWQVDEHEGQEERIPADRSTLEIVIRR
jgi:hypothetical protein